MSSPARRQPRKSPRTWAQARSGASTRGSFLRSTQPSPESEPAFVRVFVSGFLGAAAICGRINIHSGPLALLFMDMLGQGYSGDDRFNVAPTDPVDVLRCRRDGPLEAVSMRWWLTPYWSKEPTTRYSMFNAKAETLTESRAFREPFERRRCLVPIAGFYEWARANGNGIGSRKTAYYIRPRDDGGLLLAGIWDRWRGADSEIQSFAIVTTTVHDKLRFVHDRQPVMLSREEGRRWVARESSPSVTRSLLTNRLPCDLVVLPVSDYVNSTRNQGPRCAEPIGPPIVLDRAA